MTRAEIKEKAKEITKTNKWNIWKAYLIPSLITILVSMFLVAIGIEAESKDYQIINLILSIAIIPMQFGIVAYTLGIVRGEEANLNKLKEYYPMIGRLLIITILTAIFVILWSILFIIPGIIVALGYSMVNFIAVENPELSASEVLKKSKEIMTGHKWEFVVFQLSFIGWEILSVFTLGILQIWLMPYTTIALAVYYDELEK